jgi:hypothetical protein
MVSLIGLDYRNAKYVDRTRIECEINHPEHGWIPYLLDPEDTDMTVNNDDLLDNMAAKGDVTPLNEEEYTEFVSNEVRTIRTLALENIVDPLVTNPLRWAELTAEKQAEWTQFRRDLLDVTEQEGFPHEVVWPTKPE